MLSFLKELKKPRNNLKSLDWVNARKNIRLHSSRSEGLTGTLPVSSKHQNQTFRSYLANIGPKLRCSRCLFFVGLLGILMIVMRKICDSYGNRSIEPPRLEISQHLNNGADSSTQQHDSKSALVNEIYGTISIQLNKLRNLANSSAQTQTPKRCSKYQFVGLGSAVGRTGNRLIQISHGLWFAKVTGRTFILPNYASSLFSPFDLSLLRNIFCIKDFTERDLIFLVTMSSLVSKQISKQIEARSSSMKPIQFSNDSQKLSNLQFRDHFNSTSFHYTSNATSPFSPEAQPPQLVSLPKANRDGIKVNDSEGPPVATQRKKLRRALHANSAHPFAPATPEFLLQQALTMPEVSQASAKPVKADITKPWQYTKIDAKDAYVGRNVWTNNAYKDLWDDLPPYDDQLMISSLSEHHRLFSAAVWGSLEHTYIKAVVKFVHAKLSGDFRFASVHRRQFEGQCSEWMAKTKHQDFLNNGDFSLNLTAFGRRWKHHKSEFCNMPIPLIDDLCRVYKQPCKNVHVAWDGLGNVSEYVAHKHPNKRFALGGAKAHEAPSLIQGIRVVNSADWVDSSIVDMALAMLADFFIMNPLSTWSWQIAIIRSILGLPTAPALSEPPAAGSLSLWMYEESNSSTINYTAVWRNYSAKYLPPTPSLEPAVAAASWYSWLKMKLNFHVDDDSRKQKSNNQLRQS